MTLHMRSVCVYREGGWSLVVAEPLLSNPTPPVHTIPLSAITAAVLRTQGECARSETEEGMDYRVFDPSHPHTIGTAKGGADGALRVPRGRSS